MELTHQNTVKKRRIVVIGAGASGMMAAGRAAETGAEVILLEKTDQPGKKLLLSGKTRCNLTNTKGLDDFIAMYGPNGRFLYSAFSRFFRSELLDFLKKYGVVTKIERGGRIFPLSDESQDVVNAFRRYLKDQGVKIRNQEPAIGISHHDGQVTGVNLSIGHIPADAVVLATEGPATRYRFDRRRVQDGCRYRPHSDFIASSPCPTRCRGERPSQITSRHKPPECKDDGFPLPGRSDRSFLGTFILTREGARFTHACLPALSRVAWEK